MHALPRRTFGLVATAAALLRPATAAENGMDAATEAKLKQALAGAHRKPENSVRDKYRHPLETLKFFGLRQDMTVVEVTPGGGWFTEVIAPVLKDTGRYIAGSGDSTRPEAREKQLTGLRTMLANNKAIYGNAEAAVIGLSEGGADTVPAGTADLVVTFRNIHNWMAQGNAEAMFKAFNRMLKPGGYLGVVEHRAPATAPQDPKAANGYVREDHAIALAEQAGFKLVAKSEVNANPKDTKDYPGGVWTLPPNLSGSKDEASRAKFVEIGESDRFTHLYQKA